MGRWQYFRSTGTGISSCGDIEGSLELARSGGIIIVGALELAWTDGNYVGAQEQESARYDNTVGALELARSGGIIVGALELALANDIGTGKAIELSWTEDTSKEFEGNSLDVSRSDKAIKVGRAIDSSLEVNDNIGRALYENIFDVSPSGEAQKACDYSLNQGCWQSIFGPSSDKSRNWTEQSDLMYRGLEVVMVAWADVSIGNILLEGSPGVRYIADALLYQNDKQGRVPNINWHSHNDVDHHGRNDMMSRLGVEREVAEHADECSNGYVWWYGF